MAPSVSDVEDLASNNWTQMDQSQKQALLEQAERFVSSNLGGRVATLSEIEGNQDDLVALIAAHFYELSEGGEAQSESATGGSVNYNTVTGETYNGLSETRYGRMALEYVRNEQAISLVRTW